MTLEKIRSRKNMKNKKVLFAIGTTLLVIGVINLLLLTYGFRDFSLQLTLMFLVALVAYPYGIYLMIRNKPSFKEESKASDDKEDMKKMREMYESD